MTAKYAVVNNTVGITATSTADFTSSGFGTPTGALIIYCNANSTNNPQNNAEIGAGLWDATDQRTVVAYAVDGVSTTSTARGSNDAYAMILGTTESDYTVSNITDGIRLTMSVDGTSLARFVTVILFTGISAKVVSFTAHATQNSSANTASIGFTPEVAFIIGVGSTTADLAVPTTTAVFTLGIAEIGGYQANLAWNSTSAVADEASAIKFSDDRIYTRIVANAVTASMEVTAWNADDITITTRDGAGTGLGGFMLVLGGADFYYQAGTFTTPTSDSTVTTMTSMTPEAVFLAVANPTSTTIATTTPGADSLCLGMSDTTGFAHAHAICVEDGAGTTDTLSYYYGSGIGILGSLGDFSTNILADLAEPVFNSGDFQIPCLQYDATAHKGFYFAVGQPIVAGGQPYRKRLGGVKFASATNHGVW